MTKTLTKIFVAELALVVAVYASFRFLGGFSSRQSAVLTFAAWIVYAVVYREVLATNREILAMKKARNAERLIPALATRRRVENVFSPFSVSIEPNWHELLSDFKLIRSEEDWRQLGGEYGLPSGIYFTVIRAPSDDGLAPGLAFWDDHKMFLSDDTELREALIRYESVPSVVPTLGKHPVFDHPWLPNPELFVRPWRGGYQISLTVDLSWWNQLCKDGQLGELAKTETDLDRSFGTIRLVVATLPGSEFNAYYKNSNLLDDDQMKRQAEVTDKELEANGWKREPEGDSEIPDPWSRLLHKYFTVSHRRI